MASDQDEDPRPRLYPKPIRLSKSDIKAFEELARVGHVRYPANFSDWTFVSAVRQAAHDAWAACPETRNLPYPTEDDL